MAGSRIRGQKNQAFALVALEVATRLKSWATYGRKSARFTKSEKLLRSWSTSCALPNCAAAWANFFSTICSHKFCHPNISDCSTTSKAVMRLMLSLQSVQLCSSGFKVSAGEFPSHCRSRHRERTGRRPEAVFARCQKACGRYRHQIHLLR